MFHQKYYRQNGQPCAQRERKTYILYIYISNYTLLTLSALQVGDWGEGGGGNYKPAMIKIKSLDLFSFIKLLYNGDAASWAL